MAKVDWITWKTDPSEIINPKLVNEILNCPKIGALTLIKGTTSNCSNGDVIKNLVILYN